MRIQYVSDIHLEFYDKKNKGEIHPEIYLKPSAEYLALCGDIGIPDLASYKPFLTWCSSKWKGVFVVAGNHEYYNVRCEPRTDMDHKKQLMRIACANLPNVYFLDCDSVWLESEKIRVIGCTLWSEIHDETLKKAELDISDPRQILIDATSPATPEILRELHRIELDWLRDAIGNARVKGEKVLVLTHYLPTYQLIADKYVGNEMNSCFASHCEDVIRPPIVAWICGHSHCGKTVTINGVLCTLNPFGYPGESVPTRTRDAVLEN